MVVLTLLYWCCILYSMTAVPRTRSYITTVVVENDFIPRYVATHQLTHTLILYIDSIYLFASQAEYTKLAVF